MATPVRAERQARGFSDVDGCSTDGTTSGLHNQAFWGARWNYDDRAMAAGKRNFPSDLKLTEGSPVSVTNRQSGDKMIAYITEIQSETVTLDFNHPLAGEELHFSVEIVDLRYASEDELAHGHVHTPGADH